MQILKTDDTQFPLKLAQILSPAADAPKLQTTVSQLLAKIAETGDKAVSECTYEFDGARIKPGDSRIKPAQLEAAVEALSPKFRKAMRDSLRCVKDFHLQTLPRNWRSTNPHGAKVGENFYPIKRVGLYVPGGQVPLVSTVIMTVVPAKLAGVQEIAVCTPPRKDGTVDEALLAALYFCGVEEVYRIGGVQAIGAMGYGTETIAPVNLIAGPGNAYVMEAQRQMFGQVGVRLLPGPSEVMVIGDKSANPAYMASELLAQAEHGTGKERVFLSLTNRRQIDAVLKEIEKQLPVLSHAEAIQKVLDKNFTIIQVKNLDEMIAVTNHIAPEHLQVMVEKKLEESFSRQLNTSGAIMLGHESPTVIGDFAAGPSHTLPTGCTSRFFGGLQAIDFMRRSSVIRYDSKSLEKAAPTVRAFSAMEQLDAHGRSLELRLQADER